MKSWDAPKPAKQLQPMLLSQANIPKALHGINPRTIMGASKWQRFSLEKRTNHPYCKACGADNCVLDLHEDYEINYDAKTMFVRDYIPLCKKCHSFIHSGLLRTLVSNHRVSAEHAKDVLNSGLSICRANNIKVFLGTYRLAVDLGVATQGVKTWVPNMQSEGWGKWKLIYNDIEYYGLTQEQWMEKYR